MEYGGSRFSLDPDRVTTDRASEHVPECIRWHPRLNGTFSGTKRLRDNLRDNGGARRGDRGCFPVTFWKNKFHAKFFEFPRVGRAALLATGQSFSGYIRHSASRAASLYRKRGSPQHCFPPFVVQFAPRNWRDNLPIIRAEHSLRSEPFRPQTPSGQFARKRR